MIRLATVVINTATPAPIVKFWSDLLQTEVLSSGAGFTWLKAQPGSPRIAVQQVPDPSAGPRRVHMDFVAADVDAEVARAVQLGATKLQEHTVEDFRWVVLGDPDGNEFCIAPEHD